MTPHPIGGGVDSMTPPIRGGLDSTDDRVRCGHPRMANSANILSSKGRASGLEFKGNMALK